MSAARGHALLRRASGALTRTDAGADARDRHRSPLRSAIQLVGGGAVLALFLWAAAAPGTFALLTDQSTQHQVAVTAGTINPPTGLGLATTGGITASFTPPASGITPQRYEIFRRTAIGVYGGTPTASPTSSPWVDSTAAECSTYYYRVRSAHTNLVSAFTAEVGGMWDGTQPSIAETAVVFEAGPENVAGFVRSSGGAMSYYANVADSCAAASSLTVSFRVTAPFTATHAASYSATGWTPVAGGPTYHFRYQHTLAGGAVSNGQTLAWSVDATDPAGNTRTAAATSATGDGAGPVLSRAVMVSAVTNYYDSGYGIGEINSNDTSVPAAVRAAGAYVYGEFTDASGVSSATTNVSNIRTATPAAPLTEGAYTTANGVSWSWRSAAVVSNTDIADAAIRTFTLTATDKVGNPAVTSANQNVFIDDVLPAAGNTSCLNAGTDNASLASPDTTTWTFADTIVPSSLRTGWSGTPLVATAVLRNGTRDYFDLNGDFGLQMFQGSAYNQSWNLNNTGFVTANLNFPGTTFSLPTRNTVRLAYAGAATTAAPNSNAQSYLSTNIREASGNQPAAGYTEACQTNPW